MTGLKTTVAPVKSKAWLRLLSQSCSSFPDAKNYVVVIDPDSMLVVGGSASAPIGEAARSLVDVAIHGHSDTIRAAISAGRDYAWEEQIHRDGSGSAAGGILWSPDRSEAALMLAVDPVGPVAEVQFKPVPVSASTVLHAIYDSQFCCLYHDPRLSLVGLDPQAYLGAHAWTTTHPVDVSRTSPYIEQVLNGTAKEVEYVSRVVGPNGGWYNHHVMLRPFTGRDSGYLLTLRALGGRRPQIHTVGLTGRELAVAADFYSGLDLVAIARRYAVSEKTVRNQMSAVYGKLGVGSATEMVNQYDPPNRVIVDPIGVRPLASDSV